MSGEIETGDAVVYTINGSKNEHVSEVRGVTVGNNGNKIYYVKSLKTPIPEGKIRLIGKKNPKHWEGSISKPYSEYRVPNLSDPRVTRVRRGGKHRKATRKGRGHRHRKLTRRR